MLYPIRKLGAGGLATSYDYPSADLQPNQVSDAKNALFRDGKIMKAPGWSAQIDPFPTGVESYWFDSWESSDGIFIGFGCSDGTDGLIYTTHDGVTLTLAIIQDSGGAASSLTTSTYWQMEVFGPYLIINNGIDDPHYSYSYNSGTNEWTFRPLPGWGAADSPSGSVLAIRSYKNHLIALGVDGYPYTVFWSDLGTVEDLPTSWDYVSTSTRAGLNPLQTDDGSLVDASHLNDRLMVFQNEAATSMEYIGGDAVFAFRRLYNHGLVNHRAVQTFGAQQMYICAHGINIHDGSSIGSPAEDRVSQRFTAEVSNINKVFLSADSANHEVLICYPYEESEWPNRVLIYNWLDNTWTFESVEDGIRCVDETSVPATALTWADAEGSWGSSSGTWAETSRVTRLRAIFQLGANNWSVRGSAYTRPGINYRTTTYSSDDSSRRRLTTGSGDGDLRIISSANDSDYYAWVERAYLDLDELTGESASTKFVRAIYPQVQGEGRISFQFGTSRTTFDPVVWQSSKTLDMDVEPFRQKIDLRLTGRYLHWRAGSWEGVPHGGKWRLSGLDLDIEQQGLR
jgi:hypothetical protein